MRRMDKNNRKRKTIKSRLLVIMITLSLVAVPVIVKAQGPQEAPQYTTVVVHSGDTLWTIASEYTDNSRDVRETIYNIKKINNIDGGMIIPGQELIIPIK